MLLAGLVLLAAGRVATADGDASSDVVMLSGDSSGTTSRPSDPVEASRQVAQLIESSIAKALAGQFPEAMGEAAKAVKLNAADRRAKRINELLSSFLGSYDEAESERTAEYTQAVARVERAMLAERSRDELVKADLADKLHDVIFDQFDPAYAEIPTAEDFEDTPVEDLQKRSAVALDALDKMEKHLTEANKLLQQRTDAFASEFRRATTRAQAAISEARGVWKGMKLDKPESREKAFEAVGQIEVELVEGVRDVEALAAEKPWQVALTYAVSARSLAEDPSKLPKEKWFVDLSEYVEAKAKKSLDADEWDDANTAYSGLTELWPSIDKFRQQLDVARKHTRIVRIYGRDPKEVKPELSWKALTEGIDQTMAMTAISQVDENYVSSLDYKQISLGALDSIRILAETPESVNAFPLLKNDQKKKAFLDYIERYAQNVRARDRADHLDLKYALRGVLSASAKTVEIPAQAIVMEFMDGALGELDKFSSMYWPHDYADFEKQVGGRFKGIGIQITKEEGEPLKVVSPLAGSPAHKAGIRKDDVILAVDGKETQDLSLTKLVTMIMGPKGSTVRLTVERRGRRKPFDVDVARDEIRIPSVKGWRRLPDGGWDYMLDKDAKIGYIRLSQFTGDTHSDMVKAITELQRQGVNGLILDLRFNPGGLLTSARDVVSEFVASGRRVVSTQGQRVGGRELQARRLGSYLSGELIVLVNEYSASASEIVSGALKDWDRAMIIGQRTYGKGSVQNVITVRPRRSLLKLTTAYYYLPKGRLLHKKPGATDWGVDPDVEVFVTPQRLKRWLDIRRKTDLIQEISYEQLGEKLHKQYEEDIQLQTATTLLKLLNEQNKQ